MAAGPTGSIRIVASDASGTRRDVIYGGTRTELLALGAADPRLSQYVPARNETLEEDDVLTMDILGDAATAFDSVSVFRIPVRIQNKKTGVTRETFLISTDGGMTTTNDTTPVVGVWTQFWKYTVNAQERLRLGHTNAVNSRIYMALNST
jgi:hypothetical protein